MRRRLALLTILLTAAGCGGHAAAPAATAPASAPSSTRPAADPATLRYGASTGRYRFEQNMTAELSKYEDSKEAMLAFAEKRKPVFKGR